MALAICFKGMEPVSEGALFSASDIQKSL